MPHLTCELGPAGPESVAQDPGEVDIRTRVTFLAASLVHGAKCVRFTVRKSPRPPGNIVYTLSSLQNFLNCERADCTISVCGHLVCASEAVVTFTRRSVFLFLFFFFIQEIVRLNRGVDKKRERKKIASVSAGAKPARFHRPYLHARSEKCGNLFVGGQFLSAALPLCLSASETGGRLSKRLLE